MTAFAQAQVAKQGLHDGCVTGIADRPVVHFTDAPAIGVAQGAQTARRVEGFVHRSVDCQFLAVLERQHLPPHTIDNRLAGFAVLVDDAVRTPGQAVLEGIRGKARQRADAQPDAVERIEPLHHVVGDDRDKPRRQTALRDEGGGGILRQLLHMTGAGDVLREVEIVHANAPRSVGDVPGQLEGRCGKDSELAAQLRVQGLAAGFQVDCGGCNSRSERDAVELSAIPIDKGHTIAAAADQHFGDRHADPASADDRDVSSTHDMSP